MAGLMDDFMLGVAGIEDAVGITKDKAATVAAQQKADDAVAAGADQAVADAQEKNDEAQYTDAEEHKQILSRAASKAADDIASGVKKGALGLFSGALSLVKWIAIGGVAILILVLLFRFGGSRKAS